MKISQSLLLKAHPRLVQLVLFALGLARLDRRAAFASISTADVEGCVSPMAVSPIPAAISLINGVRMPLLGFGTAGLGPDTISAVSHAIRVGFRHIDSAQAPEWYREADVGAAVSEVLQDPSSGVSHRSELFLVSKLHPRSFGYQQTLDAFQSSLVNLRTDAVDLFLLHSPTCWEGSCDEGSGTWQEAWRALEALYTEGKIRAIGVSNFDFHRLRELLDMAKVHPAVVQNWMDPFHQDREVRQLCSDRGIHYTAYSAFGGQWMYRGLGLQDNPVMINPVLRDIAVRMGTTVPAVVTSWALQTNVSVLPRSANPNHISDNAQLLVGMGQEHQLRVFLTDDDMSAIHELDGRLG